MGLKMQAYTKETNGSTQRAELHRKIWSIADDVRGAVDGWDFKQYILGILFYRFISENMTEFFNVAEHEAGDPDFDYAKLSDEEAEDEEPVVSIYCAKRLWKASSLTLILASLSS